LLSPRRYYSATTCTPARAALHTGLHWSKLGMWWSNVASTSPWALSKDVPTLAARMREVGDDTTDETIDRSIDR
jgi:arylsulfatase A-like enzyme